MLDWIFRVKRNQGHLGCVNLKVPLRHPREDVEQKVGCICLDLQKYVLATDLNLGILVYRW